MLTALPLTFALLLAPSPAPIDDVTRTLVEELLELSGEEQEFVVEELGRMGSEDALEALLGVYERVLSRYGRRAVIRALAKFDESPELGHRAATRLAAIARESGGGVLRQAALDALGAGPKSGHPFLRWIVDSPGDELLRVGAIQRLAEHFDPADTKWFLDHYLAPPPPEPKRGSRTEPEPQPAELPPRVREVAFEVVAEVLGEADLLSAGNDENREIRLRALGELDRRGTDAGLELAREVFENDGEVAENRAAAAHLLSRREGSERLDDFLSVAEHTETPLLLRVELAKIVRAALAATDSSALGKRLAKLTKSRQLFQRLFALETLQDTDDPKAIKAIVDAVGHKDPNTAFRAMQIVLERGFLDAEKALRKALKSSRDATIQGQAARVLSSLLSGPDFEEELVSWLDHEEPRVRNAACAGLGATGDRRWLAPLARALQDEDWSTRLSALEAIESLHSVDGLGPIIEQLDRESGRMRREFADALWRMTGKEFGQVASSWQKWWAAEGEEADLVEPARLKELVEERQLRELKRNSLVAGNTEAALVVEEADREAVFFEHRVDSNRVVFVLDASISMERTLQSPYRGLEGRTRFEAAREELFRALAELPAESSFNLILFSNHIQVWEDELVAVSEESRESAREFVDDITLGFGTDIWGGVAAALRIPELDTIYVLSDGEPAGAPISDLAQIRLEFRRRRAHMGVELNAIALGPDLPLLRWLAEDAGGGYARFP